jgi:hypothetical protein
MKMRQTAHGTRIREKRNTCNILVRKPEGKRALRRPGRRWTDNIKMDI